MSCFFSFCRWIKTHWNQVIARNVEQSIIDQAMGVANAAARKQIIQTALYVLLHRTIAVGCPLEDGQKKIYLSTFRGSSTDGILLNAATVGDAALANEGIDSDNNTAKQCSMVEATLVDKVDSLKVLDLQNEGVQKNSKADQTTPTKANLAGSKEVKNLKNDMDRGFKKQSMTLKSNVQKSSLGSPGNTAPRVLRVKVPSTPPAVTTQSMSKVSSITKQSTTAKSTSLSSPIKSSPSSSKMTSSLHHLRTSSPANLGRVATNSKNTKSAK